MSLFSSVKDEMDNGACYCQSRGRNHAKDELDTSNCYCQNRGEGNERINNSSNNDCDCQNRGVNSQNNLDSSNCFCQARGENNEKKVFTPNLNENYAPDLKDKVAELYKDEISSVSGCDIVERKSIYASNKITSCDVVVRDCVGDTRKCDCKQPDCDVVVRNCDCKKDPDCDVVVRDCVGNKVETAPIQKAPELPASAINDTEVISAILSSLIRIETMLENLKK